jgi:hypothetical protein
MEARTEREAVDAVLELAQQSRSPHAGASLPAIPQADSWWEDESTTHPGDLSTGGRDARKGES